MEQLITLLIILYIIGLGYTINYFYNDKLSIGFIIIMFLLSPVIILAAIGAIICDKIDK